MNKHQRALLLFVVAAAACMRAGAQFAQQVMDAGLYNQPVNITTAAAAAALAAAKLPPGSAARPDAPASSSVASPQFYQLGVQLPACPASNVLLTDDGVPENWGNLSMQEQVTHPANALILQVAYAVWKDDPAQQMGGCLGAMGIDVSSIQSINVNVPPYGGTMTALVMRAGGKAVFVSFRGTDFEDPGDILVDADCHHTSNVGAQFGGQGNIRLHSGFYNAWQALEPQVSAAINEQLAKVTGPRRVHFIGHSLGASLAAIAALKFNHLWTGTGSEVSGVWLFGCPRIGNAGWQREYNRQLLRKTLRFSNFADFAARLPMTTQLCPLTHLNGTFTFRHVGKSVLLCPNQLSGLVSWQLEPRGSETLDCGVTADLPDLTIKTHWLGSYLDAWRRGVTAATGDSLASSVQVANTVCAACSGFYLDQNKQVNMPARGGGPVTCSATASCSVRHAWDAAALVDATYAKLYNPLSICLGYMCT